ncbi:MAG: (Fe-S)-binding protein [Deltaproteobacteria bacterium]|nr:(Fe-S)-binding protein [Deltaproteobacteria bacterium]
MQHADIVHRCFRCGYCKFPSDYSDFNCPSYKAFGWDTYSPGGRMWLIRAWLQGDIEATPRFAEIMFSCVTCDNCKTQCVFPKFKDFLPEIFQEARAQLVNDGRVPPGVRDYFKAIAASGNPYKRPQSERGNWGRGTGLQPYTDQEYLFYAGSVGSYDEVGQKMAKSVGRMLVDAGVSVGILGNEETCDGNDVRAMGEMGLFAELAQANIEQFKDKGIKKIITLDPHALNTFKKDYPALGGKFKVLHYTEVLADLIRKKKIKLTASPAKITYHDPCYLGRHQQIYQAPREVLKAIPQAQLSEMRRNGPDAFCCGGGGGNFFTDILGTAPDSAPRVRVREALETGANIIAVACPNCAKMLTDAVKMENLEDKLEVLGIGEILAKAQK